MKSTDFIIEAEGSCPKCSGKLISGKDGNKPVKVCLPCKKIVPVTEAKKAFVPYTPGRYVVAKTSGDFLRGDPFHILKYRGLATDGPMKGAHTYTIHAPETEEQSAYTDVMSHEEIPMLKKIDNVAHQVNESWDIAGHNFTSDDLHSIGTSVKTLPEFLRMVASRAKVGYSDKGFGASNDAEMLKRWFMNQYPTKSIDEATPFPIKDAMRVGFPELNPGDKIRTRKMSMSGTVERVEPHPQWSSPAVYFRDSEGKLMRTPLSNVTKVG